MGADRTSFDLETRRLPLSILAACLLISSCAVPVAPTGGPPDDVPPSLLSSDPPDGTTGFQRRTIELTFNEHIDRQRFAGAVSLQPDPDGRLEYNWSGRTVTITLPTAPRDETTYILTIDNSMRDARNVALDRPIVIAFATGSTINSGRVGGRILRALDGSPAVGVDVWAYEDADSTLFTGSPLYRTQTGRDGTFSFSYLRETDYFIVGVRDENGNRRLDSNEWLALGPQRLIRAEPARPDAAQTAADSTDVDGVAADSTVDDGPTWILGRYDDVPPAPERVVSLGRRHLEVRFSEPVRVVPGELSNLSVSGPVADTLATTVYSTGPGLRRTVGVHVDALSPGTWTLTGQFPVADSVGNTASPGEIVFDIPAGPDDAASRVASFLPDSSAGTAVRVDRRVTIWPGDSAGVRFDIPVPGAVQDGLLTARDTTGLELTNRLRYAAPNLWIFDDRLLGAPFELTASSADSSLTVRYERSAASETGELSGIVDVRPPAPAGARVVIEAYRSGSGPGARPGVSSTSPIRSVTVSGGPFVVRGLPGGLRVTLRAFLDTNGNGTWDAGLPVPFTAPEPVAWLNAPEPVRARWETSLSDTLTIDVHE